MIPPLAVEWCFGEKFGALVVTIAASCEFVLRTVILPLTGYFKIDIYKFLNVCVLSCISGITAIQMTSKTALLIHGVVHGLSALFFTPLLTLLMKVLIFSDIIIIYLV